GRRRFRRDAVIPPLCRSPQCCLGGAESAHRATTAWEPEAMELHTLTIVRHTKRFEAMSRFYGELLGMSTVEAWNRPDGQGAVFAPTGNVRGAHIEVLDMPGA